MKKAFKYILKHVYVILILGITISVFTRDAYLLFSMIGFALIDISLSIKSASETKALKNTLELLINTLNKDVITCPECNSTNIMKIEDNNYLCNHCNTSFEYYERNKRYKV